MKLLFNKTVSLSVLVLALLMFSACNNEEKHDEVDSHTEEAEIHAEEVELTQKEISEFGIGLDQASSGEILIYVTLPGEIIIPPDNLAHIHPRFSGIVKRVYKHIGDTIKKGETLAVIEGNESLVEYEVQSLIDGVILEKHLTPGEVVEDEDHGFVIADISTVWAQLSLYQKDLPYVKMNQAVILSAGANMPELTAKIDYISPIIDEATRTATARVVVPNTYQEWKPGLFVNAEIVSERRVVPIAIPKTSIERFEGHDVVFVYDGDGFSPREITLGLSNHTMVEVLSGLESGETYVSRGGFTLKAELEKGEMSAGHGH